MPGHIEPNGKGKWKIVIEAGRDPATGKRKRIIRHHKGRKSEAEEIMVTLLSEMKKGTYIKPSKITVAEWLATWLNDYKKIDLRPTTWESYETMARVHIIPSIGALYLSSLRPEHLQKLYNDKLEEGKSSRTVRYIHHVIHSALKQAVKNRLVNINVSEATVLPKENKKKIRALTVREQEILLKELTGNRYGTAILFLLATGLRRGELLALQWKDIDFKNSIVQIEKGLVRTRNGIQIQAAKTEKSNRTIPLPNILIHHLKEHRENMLQEGNYSPGNPIFCTRNGNYIVPRNLDRIFKHILKKAGIQDFGLHALRHTFATRLLEQGINLKVIQELMGHSRISVTADIYSHISPELKREAIEEMNKALIGH